MTNQERFTRTLRGLGGLDRLPMVEWAPYWDQLTCQWEQQGMPKGLANHEIEGYFGLDSIRQIWIRPRSAACPEPSHHGAALMEDEKDYAALLPLLYPKEHIEDACRQAMALKPLHDRGEIVFWLTLEGFFWYPRTLFGIEGHRYAFYDYPELMHQMNETLTQYHLSCIEAVCDILKPDFMTFAEDMSYNNGPMLSKSHFDEFLAPYYRRVIPELIRRDIPVLVDTDGDVTKMIPWLKSVGVQGILPLERQAGVDVNAIRRDYPDFMLIGGYDKTIMHLGESAMRAEFERLLPAMRAGRYIPSVDHQTPPGVTLDQYRDYVRLLTEYTTRAVQP